MACHSDVMKSLMATSTVTAWSATSVGSIPTGSVGSEVGHLGADIVAQRENVAGVAHGDGEADGGLSIHAEHGLRRIDVAAAHGGDVAQGKDPVTGHNRQRLDVALLIEGAADAQEHALLVGLHHARRTHRILRLQRCQDGRQIKPQAGQFFSGELDKYLLVLRAQHLNLGDVRHLQQARARRFDVVAQLTEGETVGSKGVDDAKSIAEVVVEERADHAAGQGLAHVADILAHLVPDIGNRFRWRGLLQVDEDCGLARRGVAAHPVEMVGFLQRALQTFGDLQHGLLDCRAGPCSSHHHAAKGKGRVFTAAQVRKRARTRDHRDDHQENYQGAFGERPLRQVWTDHDCVRLQQTHLLAGAQRVHTRSHHQIARVQASTRPVHCPGPVPAPR